MEKQKRILAIFDFDGTMIRGDSVIAFVRLALKRKQISRLKYGKLVLLAGPYYLKWLSDEAYKNIGMRFYYRLSLAEREKLDRDFVRENLLPRVYPKAKACLAERKKENCLCLLVSASTENYMQYVSDALGFDQLLCTQMDENGRVVRNCKGREKVNRIQAYLCKQGIAPDWEHSFAYGDSKSDLPVLSLCGRGTKVNPKKKLNRAAPLLPTEKW